jgi:hypothetical protein
MEQGGHVAEARQPVLDDREELSRIVGGNFNRTPLARLATASGSALATSRRKIDVFGDEVNGPR